MLNLNSRTGKKSLFKTRVENVGFEKNVVLKCLEVSILTVGGILSRSKEELEHQLEISNVELEEVYSQIQELDDSIVEDGEPIKSGEDVEVSNKQVDSDVLKDQIFLEINSEDDIVEVLARQLGFEKNEIKSRARNLEIVKARDIICYLLREYGDMSYPAIGKLLDRNHSTIIHAHNKLKRRFEEEPALENELLKLTDDVKTIKERKILVETDHIPSILAAFEFQKIVRKTNKFKEIPERNFKILELYREGLTLQNISTVFNITRERVRQVVLNTIRQNAINESVLKGIVMDSDILVEEESKKRKKVQLSKRLSLKPFIQKEKRWRRYYVSCRSCGTASIPHIKKGYCEECIGSYRGIRRDDVIIRHNNKCDVCQISRAEANILYSRDFYITKTQKVLCRKHFLEATGKILGESRRKKRLV